MLVAQLGAVLLTTAALAAKLPYTVTLPPSNGVVGLHGQWNLVDRAGYRHNYHINAGPHQKLLSAGAWFTSITFTFNTDSPGNSIMEDVVLKAGDGVKTIYEKGKVTAKSDGSTYRHLELWTGDKGAELTYTGGELTVEVETDATMVEDMDTWYPTVSNFSEPGVYCIGGTALLELWGQLRGLDNRYISIESGNHIQQSTIHPVRDLPPHIGVRLWVAPLDPNLVYKVTIPAGVGSPPMHAKRSTWDHPCWLSHAPWKCRLVKLRRWCAADGGVVAVPLSLFGGAVFISLKILRQRQRKLAAEREPLLGSSVENARS